MGLGGTAESIGGCRHCHVGYFQTSASYGHSYDQDPRLLALCPVLSHFQVFPSAQFVQAL